MSAPWPLHLGSSLHTTRPRPPTATCARLLTVLLLTALSGARGAIHPLLRSLPAPDTTVVVWTVFSDKDGVTRRGSALTRRALTRRRIVGYPSLAGGDLPVNRDYVNRVETAGGRLRHTFRWANAASFEIDAKDISRVAALGFVRHVIPVRRFSEPRPPAAPAKRLMGPAHKRYGESYRQFDMVSVPLAQEYIARYRNGSPGKGVLIGVFDTGFWLDHDCFDHITATRAVVADSDFVAHDSDPTENSLDHGAYVLSVLGGFAPGHLIGSAWDANYVLARTEDVGSERHIEEDNWAAALVWAESLGVDIVNSSLGYRTGYTPPDQDYTYEDMDGRTTIIAQAVQGALARGVIVVSSMGNDGDGIGTLNSPADAEGVVSVGAVDTDELIASYSGRGPTADGRMKPDLVAMGTNVLVAGATSGAYTRVSGTSLSSPLAAGVVALMRQCYPDLSSAQLVQRLYGTCRLARGQDSVDNIYGRGIPDALLGCMRDDELFVVAEDSLGRRVLETRLVWPDRGLVVQSDSGGTMLMRLGQAALPVTVMAAVEGQEDVPITVDTLPAYRRVQFEPRREVVVTVVSPIGEPIASAYVGARVESAPHFYRTPAGADGVGEIVLYADGPVEIEVSAPHYRLSRTVLQTCSEPVCTTTIALEPLAAARFVLYPNIISRSRGAESISVEFIVDHALRAYPYIASVRTMSGTLVWRKSGVTPAMEPLRLTYRCRNGAQRALIPGTYLFLIECDGKVHMKKFMITG